MDAPSTTKRRIMNEEEKGNKEGQGILEALNTVHEMTLELFSYFIAGEWPRPRVLAAFGIESDDHYEALVHAVASDDVTLNELDRALGSGVALTALIRSGNPYHGIEFRTMWDELKPADVFLERFDPVIFRYSRRQALEYGVLVDVTETAKEAYIKSPMALTARV
jgi:hypothetical protein